MRFTTTRWTDLFAFFICILLLTVAAYLQYGVGLIPCPLCIIQRFTITLLGILFLMGSLFNFAGITRCYLHIVTFLLATIGAVVASRQLWLEHVPVGQLSSCQATITQYGSSIYLHRIVELFFQGTSNCGANNWHFLGFSMPMWTLLCFIILAVLALRQIHINRLEPRRRLFS